MNENMYILYLLILALLIGITPFLWDHYKCYNTASNMHVECRYNIISGCFIKEGNQMIPLENYRKIN